MIRQLDIFLDERHLLYVRPNGTWVIRRLSGGGHEHAISFRSVREGHVIARGRVLPPSRLVVTRSDLSLKALRALVAPSGADYGITVMSAKQATTRSSRHGRY